MRAPVSWNGRGRPSPVSAIASPSSTSVAAGRAATASTTSGTRSVISSRLRVNTWTAPACLCTWIRMPSSLLSTATVAPSGAAFVMAWPTSGALEASIGRTGRPGRSVNAASASSPPPSAAAATGSVDPANIDARRTVAAGSPAATATASSISPSSAPWRSSPVTRPRR